MKPFATTLLVAALLAAPILALPPPASAAVSVGIAIDIAPPALPVYAQPMIPGAGYIWTPGYWAWGPVGYYWVPGVWVLPPRPGLLWTPGWWGWSAGHYRWSAGYWGVRVGFYGGVNYGYGYFGSGYSGGYWRGRNFYYNRSVNNINVTSVHNVYVNKTVINNVNVSRVSYNGGHGGLTAMPTAAQRSGSRERRWSATTLQSRQRETALRDPGQRFNANQGHPAVFATQRAGRFEGPHTVRGPGAPGNRMVEAPDRAHGMVMAPRDHQTGMANRGAVEAGALRARGQAGPGQMHPAPEHANRGPRNDAARARQAPAREGQRGNERRPKNDQDGHR